MVDEERMERELLVAARQGQQHAGAFLVSMFGPRLMGYCRSITADMSDLDRDFIVELAVEKAVRKIDRYDPARGRFESWLKTFVLHQAQDYRRNRARTFTFDPQTQPGLLDSHSVFTDDDSTAPTSHRLALAVDAIRDALPQLRVPDQLILAMRVIEGRTVADTATRLGITQDACRQRHHRARARLKRILSADPRLATLTGDLP